MSGLERFLREARRRRVFRVAGLYIVGAWLLVQVASEALPALDLEAGAIRYVWLATILGFPLALVFSWFYDVTPSGIVRTQPADAGPADDLTLRRTDYLLLAGLGIVAIAIALQLGSLARDSGSPAIADADPMAIAVMPLQNLSGDPEQVYFVAGMHDALISTLSRISGFRVTSRTSTRAYSDSEKTAKQIAAELGVSRLIEGSVYRAGDRVRIFVQLIDAVRDTQLWEKTYERELADVLRMQSDITRTIADEIRVELTKTEQQALATAQAVNPEAYEAYLKGKFHAEQFTPENMMLAVRFYERAIELDPESALAYWGLSRICRFQVQAGLARPRDHTPRCREYTMRAFEIDNSLAQAHLGLALGFWLYDYNWTAAEASFRRALELNPSFAEARMFYSHLLAHVRRPEESTEQILLARELDPLNVFVKALHGAQMALVGEVEQGVAQLEECLREAPSLGFGYDVLWFGYARLEKWQESYEAALKHFGITMADPRIVAALERGYAAGGFREAMSEAGLAAERISTTDYVPAFEIAMLWRLAGKPDKHLAWLDRAYEWHDPTLPYVAPWRFADTSDPRYRALLQRLDFDMWIDEPADIPASAE